MELEGGESLKIGRLRALLGGLPLVPRQLRLEAAHIEG
jgi:hypothetical protein